MKLKFCSCPMCKAGRHCIWGQAEIRRIKKGSRRMVKMHLAMGEYEKIVPAVSVPYLG